MQKTKLDSRALKEVYEVLLLLNSEELNKIPKSLIDAIKNNCDIEYEVDFEKLEDEMLPDTEKILSTIYIDYLSTDEEKNIIKQLIVLEKQKKEQERKGNLSVNIENKNELLEVDAGKEQAGFPKEKILQEEKAQEEKMQQEEIQEEKLQDKMQSLTTVKQESLIDRIIKKIKKWMERGA